jgi:hypothetical protein
MSPKNASSRSAQASVIDTMNVGDRRTRTRLRDLCDEVLASFRLASRGDLFSEQDRAEARALMSQVSRSA